MLDVLVRRDWYVKRIFVLWNIPAFVYAHARSAMGEKHTAGTEESQINFNGLH